MYKMLFISVVVLLSSGYLQAQDTTALRSESFADTAKITIVQREFLPLPFNSQIYGGNLMNPLSLKFNNTLQFNPNSRLSTYGHYNQMGNRTLGAQQAMQSLQMNLKSSLLPNKAAISVGILVNAVCLGGVVYQMMQPPKPDPNRPKGASPQPQGAPPRPTPAPKK